MNVKELDRDQLVELKQALLTASLDGKGETPSMGELADAGALSSDEELFDVYEDTEFSPDDFFCSSGA